jgi:hypothetical protein
VTELIIFLFYVYLLIYAISCIISFGIVYFVVNNYLPNYGGYFYLLYIPIILFFNYFFVTRFISQKEEKK